MLGNVGARMTGAERTRMDAVLRIPDETYPVVVSSPTWVAVRWSSGGAWHVIDSDGNVSERFTLPQKMARR
jgi:hypothetical protein